MQPLDRRSLTALVHRLHFYIGIFIAPFIFIAALTGFIYILSTQFEDIIYRDVLKTQPSGNSKPLSSQISAARHYVGEQYFIHKVRPAPQPDETTYIQFMYPNLESEKLRTIFIDPYSLAIKADYFFSPVSGFLPTHTWLTKLHTELYLGSVGRHYSELAASWLWVSAITGVILWINHRRKHLSRKKRSPFAFTRHWHITLGLLLFLGMLFMSVTGLTWSKWAGDNINALRTSFDWLTPQLNTKLKSANEAVISSHNHGDHQHEDHNHKGLQSQNSASNINKPDLDWEIVLYQARRNGIKADNVEIRQPKTASDAWTVTENKRDWPTQVDAIAINPHNYKVIDHIYFDNFPMMAKLTRWGVDAHMGKLFGMANRLLLLGFTFGICCLLLLGYRMWWIRRPSRPQNNPLSTLTACWLSLSIPWQLLIVTLTIMLGYCLPVLGASLLVFLFIDVLLWKKHKKITNVFPQ